jgi:hypothetical protein
VAEAEATIEAPPVEEAAAPVEKAESPKPGKAAKPAKEKKEKKGKKDKGSDGEEAAGGPSVAGHPRAARAVGRAKGWGALIGFVLGGYESLPTHTVAETLLRALIAGAVLYVGVWAGAVFFWRRMVMLEIKAREQQLAAAAAAAADHVRGLRASSPGERHLCRRRGMPAAS